MFRSCTGDVRRIAQRSFAAAPCSSKTPLSRLPKAPGNIKALKYRRSTPGSASKTIYATSLARLNPLDRGHPALGMKMSAMPTYNCPAFALRIIPLGLLEKPEMARHFPRHDDFGVTHKKGDPTRPLARMALVTLFSKAIARSNFIRNRIRARLKTALGLVAARQAVVDEQGELQVDGGTPEVDAFLLKDWCYVFTPAAELYRMPMEDIIVHCRAALLSIAAAGRAKEQQWSKPKSEKLTPKAANVGRSTKRAEAGTKDSKVSGGPKKRRV